MLFRSVCETINENDENWTPETIFDKFNYYSNLIERFNITNEAPLSIKEKGENIDSSIINNMLDVVGYEGIYLNQIKDLYRIDIKGNERINDKWSIGAIQFLNINN